MANPALSPEAHGLIWEYSRQKLSARQIIREMVNKHGIKVAVGTVHKFSQIPPTGRAVRYQAPGIRSDKKRGEMDWEEWTYQLEKMQDLKHKASDSQDHAFVELGDGNRPVALCDLSDAHIGSWGTNYQLLRELTHEINETPDLYLGLVGDEGQYAIALRNVLEVCDNIMPPELQTKFIQDWFDHIWHKVAFATWSNHGVERQEKQSGESSEKAIKSKRVVYFNGIGHVDIKVGSQIYRGAVSHSFHGKSFLNPVHTIMRYMRMEGTDREWGMAGHTHQPGMMKYTDGDKVRVAINSGSLQSNSGYGKRYFSLTTHPTFPILVFHPDRHEITPFWSIKEWLAVRGK
jgi:ribosomal protein L21E